MVGLTQGERHASLLNMLKSDRTHDINVAGGFSLQEVFHCFLASIGRILMATSSFFFTKKASHVQYSIFIRYQTLKKLLS